MLIKVKDIKPNPFRNIESYKIDPAKVDSLKTSIAETSFWDNLLVRSCGKAAYQLAYGHHRLEALKALKIKEIDIPVKELDDSTMLRIMAAENLTDWAVCPSVINETVFATKRFLDELISSCKTPTEFEELPDFDKLGLKVISTGSNRYAVWANIKKKGVGKNAISSFLGKNWGEARIQEALSVFYNSTEAEIEARAEVTAAQASLDKAVAQEKEAVDAKKDARAKEVRAGTPVGTKEAQEQIQTAKDNIKIAEGLKKEASKKIQTGLAKVKDLAGGINKAAYEMFNRTSKARQFRRLVEQYKIPDEAQEKLAGKIIAEANKVEEAGGPKPDMEVWFKMYKKTLRPEKEVERSTKDFSIIRTALAVGKRTEAFVEYLSVLDDKVKDMPNDEVKKKLFNQLHSLVVKIESIVNEKNV